MCLFVIGDYILALLNTGGPEDIFGLKVASGSVDLN